MQPDELITIRSFDNVIEAYQIKNVLENENIEVYVTDEYVNTLQPLYNHLLGGVKLRIRFCDKDKAEKIILASNEIALTNEQDIIIACPKCKSARIDYHLKSLKNPPGIFAILISFLIGGYPLYSKDFCHCKEFGFKFEKKND